jgi:hypothetical protein
MGRAERRVDPAAGPVQRFAYELRHLRQAAGNPSYRRMAERAHYSPSSLSEAAGGRVFPSWGVTRSFVIACESDPQGWAPRWQATAHEITSATALEVTSAVALHPGTEPVVPGTAADTEPSQPTRISEARNWMPMAWALSAVTVICLVATLAVYLSLSAPPASVSAPPTSAFLGPADLARYCRTHGYSGAALDGLTAYDWHCERSTGQRVSLSVIDACRWQYRRATATARYDDIRIPDSWQCWDHVVVLGRVDLDRYCRARGFTASSLAGTTVDTWSCVSVSGTRRRIDPDSACRWQYGRRVLVANPGLFHTPWEQWDCWG